MFETKKSGNKTCLGDIGLDIRTKPCSRRGEYWLITFLSKRHEGQDEREESGLIFNVEMWSYVLSHPITGFKDDSACVTTKTAGCNTEDG